MTLDHPEQLKLCHNHTTDRTLHKLNIPFIMEGQPGDTAADNNLYNESHFHESILQDLIETKPKLEEYTYIDKDNREDIQAVDKGGNNQLDCLCDDDNKAVLTNQCSDCLDMKVVKTEVPSDFPESKDLSCDTESQLRHKVKTEANPVKEERDFFFHNFPDVKTEAQEAVGSECITEPIVKQEQESSMDGEGGKCRGVYFPGIPNCFPTP